jgi:hypothetical protein
VISSMVMVFSFSSSVSRTLKATPLPLSVGCADWWAGEGSIDLKLGKLELVWNDGREPYSWPKKSRKYATVFFALRTSWLLACPP